MSKRQAFISSPVHTSIERPASATRQTCPVHGNLVGGDGSRSDLEILKLERGLLADISALAADAVRTFAGVAFAQGR